MKRLAGKITISKTSGRDENPVFIQIDDEISGCRFLEVSMTLEEFAEALFGRGWIPCQLAVNVDAPIGMKAENKEEIVPFNCWYSGKKQEGLISKALIPFEIDGWKARRQDMTNGHCRAGNEGQRVVFFRHVDPETGKPVIK